MEIAGRKIGTVSQMVQAFPADRETDRQRDRETDRQTDTHTHIHTHTHTFPKIHFLDCRSDKE